MIWKLSLRRHMLEWQDPQSQDVGSGLFGLLVLLFAIILALAPVSLRSAENSLNFWGSCKNTAPT